MFIEKFKNNGVEYLRLVSSKRITDACGRKVSRKHVELNIGPFTRFDDGKPDYYERLKESFRNGVPIIPSLIPFVSPIPNKETYTITFQRGSHDCTGHPKYFSHLLLDQIFSELGLSALFATFKHYSKITYDLQGFVRMLVFGRVLNPASKFSTILQSDHYFSPPLTEYYPYNVYDVLDIIHENKSKIIRRMNSSINKGWGRNTEVIFYDVTNFYFEVDEPDDDIEDADEIIQKGIRKMGVCKEQRKQPIVQMGLFLDDMGIPISIEMFSGNTLDQATLRPALKNSIDLLGYSRFILIADRGLCSYKNILHLKQAGHGYIISKSIKKSKKTERAWILNQDGYIQKDDAFKYKSRITERKEKDEDGKTHTFQEKVVVYWSKKFHDREARENKTFLEFIEKLKLSPASFRVSNSQNRCLRKFLKKDVVHTETGEILDSKKLLTMIDEKRLEEFTEQMGYYQIITSELNMEPLEVIDKYHGLTQIEDQFRVMKGDLDTRPVYVRKPEHIEAHLLICMIALTMIRIIQRRLVTVNGYKKPENRYWTYGLSGERIQEALKKWKIDILPGDFYRFCDVDDMDLSRLLNAFGIKIPNKLFSQKDLQQIKSDIKVFL